MTIESGILKTSGVIQFRGGTTEAVSTENPTPLQREIVVEFNTDGTGYITVGNGENSWQNLPYAGYDDMAALPSDDKGTIFVVQDGQWVSAATVIRRS